MASETQHILLSTWFRNYDFVKYRARHRVFCGATYGPCKDHLSPPVSPLWHLNSKSGHTIRSAEGLDSSHSLCATQAAAVVVG